MGTAMEKAAMMKTASLFCFCGEIRHNFLGFVGGVIVADNSDNVTLGIHGIEFFQ